MAKSTKLVAVFSLAGTMLALSTASFAQERLRQVYVPPIYVDCYYNTTMACGSSYGSYAAFGPVAYDSYAAVVSRSPYPGFWRGLRAGDWTAIHGANN
jgi:hypothetical protein